MNDNKLYYTPSISEFYVSFEFEFLTGGVNWKPFTFDLDRPERILSNVKEKPEMFRVKYLDKLDIESLGFKVKSLPYQFFDKEDRYMLVDLSNTSFHLYSIVDRRYEECIFRGFIKNKSELQVLLKQLGI